MDFLAPRKFFLAPQKIFGAGENNFVALQINTMHHKFSSGRMSGSVTRLTGICQYFNSVKKILLRIEWNIPEIKQETDLTHHLVGFHELCRPLQV